MRSAYLAKGVNEKTTDELVSYYDKKGNQLSGWGVNAYIDCGKLKTTITTLTYLLIWLFPLLLVTPLIWHYIKRRRLRNPA